MPDGLTDTLTRGELLDLVRFLSELGKVGPVLGEQGPAGAALAGARAEPRRRPSREAYGPATATRADAGLNWSSAYSTVFGSLPLAELPRLPSGRESNTNTLSFIRFQLDAARPARSLSSGIRCGG